MKYRMHISSSQRKNKTLPKQRKLSSKQVNGLAYIPLPNLKPTSPPSKYHHQSNNYHKYVGFLYKHFFILYSNCPIMNHSGISSLSTYTWVSLRWYLSIEVLTYRSCVLCTLFISNIVHDFLMCCCNYVLTSS